jgi:single-strand DNA-binding protein
MANLNVWTGTGNLVTDPETRTLSTGKTVTNFRIGVSTGFGERKSTLFLNVEAWEKLGAFVQQYAHKGSIVAVTGELHCREYTNNNGEKKQSWEIKAREVEAIRTNSAVNKEHTSGGIDF